MGRYKTKINPITGTVQYYDGGREILTAWFNDINFGYDMKDARGRNIGHTAGDEITLQRTCYDADFRKIGRSSYNQLMDVTTYYDRSGNRIGEEYGLGNSMSLEGWVDGETPYTLMYREKQQELYREREAEQRRQSLEEKKREEQARIAAERNREAEKKEQIAREYAGFIAFIMQKYNVPYDGSMYELSSVVTNDAFEFNRMMGFVSPSAGFLGMLSYQSKKKLEEYRDAQGMYRGWTEDMPSDRDSDMFYLLHESVQEKRPNSLGGYDPETHELLVLTGRGALRTGRYEIVRSSGLFSKKPAVWKWESVLPYTDYIADYAAKNGKQYTFEVFEKEIWPNLKNRR